jgi:cysteine desulfurase
MDAPIYLDNHATTRVDPRVVEAMTPLWAGQLGNPSSPHHAPARRAAEVVEAGRGEVAALLHAEPREIVFTSGATEANNLALLGVMRATPPGSHLVVSAIEHASVLEPAERLRREGFGVTVAPVDRLGRVDPERVQAALTPQTALVSIMAANNEIGTIQPIREIASICRDAGVLFHTDAVQVAGCLPLPFDEWPVDLASVSSHKLYGPIGVGALYVRRRSQRIAVQPLVFGGGQEHRRRAGTLATPLIAGFGAACRLVRESLAAEPARIAALRDRLWARLQQRIDDVQLHGDPDRRLPGNLHVGFSGVDGDALLVALPEVAVSSGAACTVGDHKLSHVLRVIGLDDAQAKSSLRFGVGRFNTESEIDRAADIVADAVARLRGSTATALAAHEAAHRATPIAGQPLEDP